MKIADYYWTDPTASELIQRHRIHSSARQHGRLQRGGSPQRPALRVTSGIILPAKAWEYVFTGVGLCVGLSVTRITKKIVDRFVPNFMGRFLGGKGRPSSCFVTIGRGTWK